eukprot:6569597-Alexandrium_andersonii.AAC.1
MSCWRHSLPHAELCAWSLRFVSTMPRTGSVGAKLERIPSARISSEKEARMRKHWPLRRVQRASAHQAVQGRA